MIALKMITSLLFGGMTLFSFGFAFALLRQMGMNDARKIIRSTFPMYYSFVIIVSSIAALVSLFFNPVLSKIMVGVLLSTIFARQILMPKINNATDSNNKKQFHLLHSLSVGIQLAQIVGAGYGVITL